MTEKLRNICAVVLVFVLTSLSAVSAKAQQAEDLGTLAEVLKSLRESVQEQLDSQADEAEQEPAAPLDYQAVLAFLDLDALPAGLQGEDAPLHDCDRLTRYQHDLQSGVDVPTVDFDSIDAPAAIAACHSAQRDYPGTPRFTFQLARAYDANEDQDQAFPAYKDAARQGYAVAFTTLADWAYWGTYIEEDERLSAEFYLAAAELGNADAMYQLGYAYEDGLGVPEDDTQAVFWYEKAVALDHTEAKTDLAFKLYYGEGVEEDEDRAWALIWDAASEQDDYAMWWIGDGYLDRLEPQVPYDFDKGMKWLMLSYGFGGEYSEGFKPRQWRWVTDFLAAQPALNFEAFGFDDPLTEEQFLIAVEAWSLTDGPQILHDEMRKTIPVH